MEKLEAWKRGEQVVDLSVRGGRKQVGHLTREILIDGDDRMFRVRGADVQASRDGDVFLAVWERGIAAEPGGSKTEYPTCPDCRTSGSIVWRENGYVPGTRECQGCRSLFADSRFAAHGFFGADAIIEAAAASGLGTIYPQSRTARDWLRDNVEFSEWQKLDSGGLVIDPRFLDDVITGMLTDDQVLLSLAAGGLEGVELCRLSLEEEAAE